MASPGDAGLLSVVPVPLVRGDVILPVLVLQNSLD